ncbi:MAG: hypothetical protein IJX77_10680 [Ruminococcus sp.]|nr:hypothetical protein [Ruminococcus sp.]
MGSFEYAAVCLGGGILSVLASVIWFSKKNIVESSVLGVIFFFCSYIVSSMGLFVLDCFTLFRAAVLNLALNAVLLGAVVFLRRSRTFSVKKLIDCDFSLRSMLIPIIVCVMAFPFIMTKNEIYGMGQDQGGYQIQAINFMYGDNARQKDFEEYHLLETDEEREVFEYLVKNALRGYDIPDPDYPETVYDENVSPVSGIIHGIPTYASMLAMWGSIFGMENMLTIETIFYMCMIFLIYFICRNLGLKNISCLAACVSAAAAPVVIWVAKASLTEMFLALLPSLFMYFMTDDSRPRQKWMSIIPVAVFGCYHVSIYTLIPIFFIIYAGMYFFTRQKQYAVLMPVTLLGYLASYFMMRHVQPFYTMNNYSPVFVGGINVSNISTVVVIACIAGLLASAVYIFAVSRKSRDFSAAQFSKKASENRWFRLLLSLLLVLPIVYIAAKLIGKYGFSGDEIKYAALWGFICNAGILLIPAAVIAAVIFPKFIAEKPSRLTVYLMFFYCVLVYSAVLRPEIEHYYYYSRYLAPFIPIAAAFAVMTLDRFGGKLILPLTAAGLAFVAPYDRFLMRSKDDTRMEWSILGEIASTVGEGDCVLIERQYMNHLWMPLRAMTDAHIYPQADDLENQFAEMAEKYDRVVFITGEAENEDDFTVLYRNKINHSEDDLNHIGEIVPMSTDFYEFEEGIFVYCFDKYCYSYTAAKHYHRFSGVSALENTFCWIDEENAEIECGLYPADYEMTVNLGGMVPLEALGMEELEVTVYVNGEKAGESAVTPENNGGSMTFELDGEDIIDGENIITLETELWNVADVNPADTRTVSIPLESIMFTAVS